MTLMEGQKIRFDASGESVFFIFQHLDSAAFPEGIFSFQQSARDSKKKRVFLVIYSRCTLGRRLVIEKHHFSPGLMVPWGNAHTHIFSANTVASLIPNRSKKAETFVSKIPANRQSARGFYNVCTTRNCSGTSVTIQ